MNNAEIVALADCIEFREAILATPPKEARLSLLLMLAMLATAFAWASVSKVDVVVKARSVVRPPEPPQEVRVAVGGEVSEVLFREGDDLPAGAVLLRLNKNKLEEQIAKLRREKGAVEDELERAVSVKEALEAERDQELAQAETNIEIAQLEFQRAERRRDQAEREFELVRAAAETAERDLARYRELFDNGIVSRAHLEGKDDDLKAKRIRERAAEEDQHSTELDIALSRKRILAAQQERDTLTQSSRARIREQDIRIGKSRSDLGGLEHDLRLLQLDLEQGTVRAPIGGIVVTDGPRPGDLLSSGDVVARIAPPGIVVEAQVPNSRIAGLRFGQSVRVKLDAYDYQKYGALDGEVAFVAPDATLIENEGQTPSSVYKVTIRLSEESVTDASRPIELGMTGIAEIVTDRERILDLVFRRLRRKSEI